MLCGGVLCILASGNRWAAWKDTQKYDLKCGELGRTQMAQEFGGMVVGAPALAGIKPGPTYYHFAGISLPHNEQVHAAWLCMPYARSWWQCFSVFRSLRNKATQ